MAYDCSAIEADGKSATLKSEMVAPVLNDSITKLFSQSYKGEEPAKDEKLLTTMHKFEKCLKNPDNKVPVYPLLVTVIGIPKSEKTPSLEKAFKVKSEINARLDHHEFIFSKFRSPRIFPVARDTSYFYGIQSGLKFCGTKVSIIGDNLPRRKSFLEKAAEFLEYENKKIQVASPQNDDILSSSIILTHGIGFLNVWDTSLNNQTIRPILEFFGGCFTRSNLWLFVDLDADIETLHLPLKGTENDSNAIGFRSQIIYLLRQCQLCKYSMYQNDTHKVCKIFATYSNVLDPQEKKKSLQDELEEAARQMDVDELIDFNIVLVDTTAEIKPATRPLKVKLGKAIERIQQKEIPLSWVYLRGFLSHCNVFCIKRAELSEIADKCGLPAISQEFGLQQFLEFFTSFGSILDMKKFDPEYIIIKPYEFLLCCDKILRSVNHPHGTIDIDQQMDKEKLCISLMLSIGMGTKLRGLTQNMCYFPTIRKGERKQTISEGAVQFVTSMASPSMQKPVCVIEALQKHLPDAEIHPDWTKNWSNTIIISTQQDGTSLNFFLSFQGDVVEIALHEKNEPATDETLQTAVSHMVRAFHAVAEEKSMYQSKIKYHFAVRCQQNDDNSIDYYPYHKRHVLPRTKFCTKCLNDNTTSNQFIQAWIAALKEDDVPDSVRLNGDLSAQDVAKVVDEVSKYPIEAIHLVSKELGQHVEKYFHEHKDKDKGRMWLVLGMLHCWQSVLDKEDESPKKVLARILVAVDKKWRERNEPNFGKLAQRIDLQVLTEHQKELIKKRKASAQQR